MCFGFGEAWGLGLFDEENGQYAQGVQRPGRGPVLVSSDHKPNISLLCCLVVFTGSSILSLTHSCPFQASATEAGQPLQDLFEGLHCLVLHLTSKFRIAALVARLLVDAQLKRLQQVLGGGKRLANSELLAATRTSGPSLTVPSLKIHCSVSISLQACNFGGHALQASCV